MVKIPKSLAACADLYYTKRDARLALQHDVDALEEDEKLLKQHLIDSIPKSDAKGVTGKLCQILAKSKEVGVIDDYDKFIGYVSKNRMKGSFALMTKALNQKAITEIWDNGKEVPGIKHFKAVTLEVHKL